MPTSLNTQFSQLLIKPRGKNNPACQVFISSPDAEQRKKLGKLFGIIEIDYYNKRNFEIIESIFAEVENDYYSEENDKPPLNTESYFERILQDVNQKLLDLIQNEEIFLNPKKLNAVIGILKDRELYFTQVGQTHAFLIHRQNGDYKIFDILASQPPEEKNQEETDTALTAKSFSKIFSNVVSGRINPYNTLFFCTESILDYISLNKLKEMLSTLPPASASEHLKNLLTKAANEINFGAIIIKLIAKEITRREEIIQVSSKKSIDELISTEEATERVLTPSLANDFKKITLAFAKLAYEFTTKGIKQIISYRNKNKIGIESRSKSLLQSIKQKLSPEGRTISLNNLLGQSVKLIKKIFAIIAQLLRFVLYLILLGIRLTTRNKKAETAKSLSLSEKITSEGNRVLGWFKKLNKTRKALLVMGIILVLLFVQSLISSTIKQSRQTKENAYRQLVAEINAKRDAAEASLIYDDEEKAQTLLAEAKSALAKLPQNSKHRKDEFKTLSQKIEKQLERAKRIVRIEEPMEITNFIELDPAIKIRGVVELDNNIYAHNSNGNLIYKLNLTNKQIVTYDATATKLGQVQGVISEDKGSLLFYDDKNTIVRFKLDGSVLKVIDINFVESEPKIEDINFYNNKLYILDTNSNQIYRHPKTETGFGAGLAWIRESNTDLTNATAITIDGSVYVLKTDGQIWKFNGGYKKDFSVKSIADPPLFNPNKIFTDYGLDYLYILDPENKRLVVINKESGRLKAQYWSDKFDNLKDFIIKDSTKKIYLLNGTRVYQIEAEHLK